MHKELGLFAKTKDKAKYYNMGKLFSVSSQDQSILKDP